MSSLAAARADNFYYGPGYDPKKHKSLNRYRGSHPLGDRASQISEGILVIRFEMPFKVWCLGCHCIIAKGVRFNAKKRCVGSYYSSKIYEFLMNCYECQQEMVITTDPKEAKYICTRGLREKLEDWPNEGVISIEDPEEVQKKRSDPIYNLETQVTEKRGRKRNASRLLELCELQESRSADSFAANQRLRQQFRETKESDRVIQNQRSRAKKNFAFPIVQDEVAEQQATRDAKKIRFLKPDSARIEHKIHRTQVLSSSIFDKKNLRARRSESKDLITKQIKRSPRKANVITSSSNKKNEMAQKRSRKDELIEKRARLLAYR